MHTYTFFFFNDTATTEIYTLSLHDALPISIAFAGDDQVQLDAAVGPRAGTKRGALDPRVVQRQRSEEHTSELQSRLHLVCRLLLEKKKHHKKKSAVAKHAAALIGAVRSAPC